MVKPQKIKVYLAGGFDSSWRERLKAELPIVGIDPFKDLPKVSTMAEMVTRDLRAIDTSELVVAHYDGHVPYGGLAGEMGYCAGTGKPLFFVCDTSKPWVGREAVPEAFLIGLATRYFEGLDSLIDWWKTRVAAGRWPI